MLKMIKVAVMIKVGLLVSFAVILLVSIEFAQFIRRCARNPCRERKGITRAVADRYSSACPSSEQGGGVWMSDGLKGG